MFCNNVVLILVCTERNIKLLTSLSHIITFLINQKASGHTDMQ